MIAIRLSVSSCFCVSPKCSGSSNSTELAELELLVSQANENDVEHDCFMKPSKLGQATGVGIAGPKQPNQ